MLAPIPQTNNSVSKGPQTKASDPADNQDLSFDSDAIRKDGVDMAKTMASSNASTDDKKDLTKPDHGVIKTANSLYSGVLALGSKVLNACGFVGATITAVLYFFFNSRIFSLITAVPTAMSFGTAFALKKSVKKNEGSKSILDDPLKILNKARNDSSFLEANFSKMVEAVVDISSLASDNPKKQQALEDLREIAEKVRIKKYELEQIDPNDQSNYEILDVNRFLDIYEKMRPNEFREQAAEDALRAENLSKV